MEQRQVIIVGAGPAGATCAKVLRDRGIDVLVIDRSRFPRHKTCSGILFGQTQVLLRKYFSAMPPESVYCAHRTIKASEIKEWKPGEGYCEYTWEIAKDDEQFPTEYHNIWRSRFDHWLIAQSGAELREGCSFTSCKGDAERVTVTVRQGGREHELACSYLIGADGCNSAVRKLVDPKWAAESPAVIAYQTYNRFEDRGSLPDEQWTVFFEQEIGDILSCVHQKDDFLTLCVGGFKGRNLKTSMRKFKAYLGEHFGVVFGAQERDEGCLLRMASPDLGVGSVLLTGEAGGFMYLNGEGISAAMDSGYRAGSAVAEALTNGGDAAEIYTATTGDILMHMNTCMQQLHFLTVQPVG